MRFDRSTGQTLLAFDAGDLERETRESLLMGMVRPLIPPADAAEMWFQRASEWDGDPERWKAAVDAYERVVDIDPGYAAAWNNLGLLHHRMGQYDRRPRTARRAPRRTGTARRPPSTWARSTRTCGDLPRPRSPSIGAPLAVSADYADAHFNLPRRVRGKTGH